MSGQTMEAGSSNLSHETPGEHTYDGVTFCQIFPPEVLSRVKTFAFRDSDVCVVTYPKAGTTWMQEIVYLVLHDGDVTAARSSDLTVRSPFIEMHRPSESNPNIDILQDMPATRIIKSHLDKRFFEKPLKQKKTKFIIVMRNIKDNLVSYFHFYRSNSALGKFKGTFSEFLEMVKSGKLVHGSWFDFNLGWWDDRHNPNVAIFKYEDMIQELRPNIERVAEFLGKELSSDVIDTIEKNVTFAAMKDNSSTNYSKKQAFMDSNVSPFMRKGVVGDWQNHFLPKDLELINELYEARMAGSSLQFKDCI